MRGMYVTCVCVDVYVVCVNWSLRVLGHLREVCGVFECVCVCLCVCVCVSPVMLLQKESSISEAWSGGGWAVGELSDTPMGMCPIPIADGDIGVMADNRYLLMSINVSRPKKKFRVRSNIATSKKWLISVDVMSGDDLSCISRRAEVKLEREKRVGMAEAREGNVEMAEAREGRAVVRGC